MNYSILSIPVEIQTRIFEVCDDFPEVLAFASTCRHTRMVWIKNSGTIIWSVGNNKIRSFDDALMAVRATAMVLEAYQAGTRPPAIDPISSLSGESKFPDLDELKEVLNMQHLVRCLEHMYFYTSQEAEFPQYNPDDNPGEIVFGKYPAERRRFPDCLQENIPGAEHATIDSFRDGFYRAMYRLLLAGAVFARVYMDPLFRAREDTDLLVQTRFFRRWGSSDYWSEEIDRFDSQLGGDLTPRDADIAYIRQSPVYNFDVPDWSEIGQWRDREYEACFGPFAFWIIEDGKKRKQNEPHDPNEITPSWAQNKEDIGAVRELMLLLVASDHLNHHFDDWTRTPYLQKQGNRTVSIIRLGEFRAEKITMPAAVEDLTDMYLFAEDHPALVGTAGQNISLQIDMFKVFWFLPTVSRSPIPYQMQHPGPPIELEFWNFALRRYLNLTFKSGLFWFPQLDCMWWREVGRGEVFLCPNWAVVQKYQPGIISWDYRNNWHL